MSGHWLRITSAARMPSSVWLGGIRTSAITTSGRSRSTAASSPEASPAVAATSNPALSSSLVRPAKSSTESSAITTRGRSGPAVPGSPVTGLTLWHRAERVARFAGDIREGAVHSARSAVAGRARAAQPAGSSAPAAAMASAARDSSASRAGRWHVAFAAVPDPVPAPGTGQAVGIDRGVAVSAALSTGDLLHAPSLTMRERRRLRRLERTLARAKRGSNRRGRARHAIARLRARGTDRRKDWAEKTSTDIARRFDVIRVEDLKIKNMTRSGKGTRGDPGRNVRQKAGLNRGILRSGWGLLVRRLEDKAPGRVEKVKPHYTSQRCSACGRVDRDSRESQAVFRCTACGFACNADVNAARNIAAGHAVTARGGDGAARPVNREPQLLLQPV